MFKQKEKYLLRDNSRRTLLLKYKYLNLIQKSLLHNRSVRKKIKLLIFLHNSQKKQSFKKIKNICMLSGENTSVNKKLLLTRFHINYLSIVNKLQNFKINSW